MVLELLFAPDIHGIPYMCGVHTCVGLHTCVHPMPHLNFAVCTGQRSLCLLFLCFFNKLHFLFNFFFIFMQTLMETPMSSLPSKAAN